MDTISFFAGRFQPPHQGHEYIFDLMSGDRNPHVCIIAGEKSSQDKDKNPLSGEARRMLISRYRHLTVFVSPNPYVAIEELSKTHTITKVYQGEDRDYEKLFTAQNLDPEFVTIPRDRFPISATEMRALARMNRNDEFYHLFPSHLQDTADAVADLIRRA